MPSRYPYQQTIRNEYLGVSKVIRAMSANELTWLIEAQRSKWREQESRKREQQQKQADRSASKQLVENLKQQAEEDTVIAQQSLETLRKTLISSLHINLIPDWEKLLDHRTFPTFHFDQPKPDKDEIRIRLLGPEPKARLLFPPKPEEPSFWEIVLPFLKRRRLGRMEDAEEDYQRKKRKAKKDLDKELKEYQDRESEVEKAYRKEVERYNARYQNEKQIYVRNRDEFLAQQESHNSAILIFRSRYESGSSEAIEQYVQMVLEKSNYPEPITSESEVTFDENSKTLVVTFWLPEPAKIPNIVEHRYVITRKEIKTVEMKPKDFDAFYDDLLHQIALRTTYEIFTADYALRVEAVVFNGWIRGIDPKTGKSFTSCILSFEASQKQFSQLDLAKVSPKDCVRGFKGITAGPLSMLAPVKPIMELNRDDDRFVESKDVMNQLRPEDNLAAMEWEDFEHLVGQLFEKEFSKTGGEVRVTQASRDRGVDAIAFDPDPIRGGKFVIQAKRYNMVVPVSAVRDLYGTMIAEGATKGILVTTSYFGRDSREFAKDKPITLLDGENLVHMFQQYGHNVHITLLPKGDSRRGSG